MLIFKSMHDLKQVHAADPVHSIVRERISALPGYVILIEKRDTKKMIDLPELKGRLENLSWEGVSKQDGYFHAVYLTNNEFALEFIIPDADWLPAEIKATLDAHSI